MARVSPYYHLPSIFLICLVGLARSDFASDENECGSQIVSLATCLSYVQGESKTPTPDCCSGLNQVLAKSKKCLCVLVKDRDDPNLNIKINATLALKLPGACGRPVNATDCIALLHLAPNSSEAQVFNQFSSGTQPNTTSTSTGKGHSTPTVSSTTSGNGSGAVTVEKSSGTRDRGHSWWARHVAFGVCMWCFVWLVNIAA